MYTCVQIRYTHTHTYRHTHIHTEILPRHEIGGEIWRPSYLGLFVEKLQAKVGLAGYDTLFKIGPKTQIGRLNIHTIGF